MDHQSHEAGLVVVGASLAGLRAVEAARRHGYGGPITLIGAEPHLPYDRPPLSKEFLTGAPQGTFFRTREEISGDLEVRLLLGTPATRLDPATRTVHLANDAIRYNRLIIATGARPRTLPQIPEFATRPVVELRTLDDAVRLNKRLADARHVVVLGGGFIGSEVASSARLRGSDVTIVDTAPVPLVRAVGSVVGQALTNLHHRNGTEVIVATKVTSIELDGETARVSLSNDRVLNADLVVVGVGAAPETVWLERSGLVRDDRDHAIVCDEFLETSVHGVYAAGDVASWYNVQYGITMRSENWTNAAEQGARAAENALFPDLREPFLSVPYYWSDWYGNRIQFAGIPMGTVEFVSGSPASDRFAALFHDGGHVVGAATLNERRLIMKFRRVIEQRGTRADALTYLPTKDKQSSVAPC
ncbi:NAD(P)/FAD-dependent oxidoreductase [Nocardia sp. bgisy134]|uniref:NAD(P)/FAD-dependent oxidoreductase n=1 Tax=Nocardia sp. bgisy134 TaxID=3413789 RepID=UPI003D73D01B